MGRECWSCERYLDSDEFSNNQWRKGPGGSRCIDCLNGYTYTCGKCNRNFNSRNALQQHSQVHRARNVACPICKEVRFRSGANAVQHVESGYCTGCRGRDNARHQIYKYASSQSGMNRYMNNVPRLTYGGYDSDDVPDYPYNCPDCDRSFRHLSQLLQHKDAKHSSDRMLTYY
mmetsp:Transcript_14782/g.20888  ORF Transcript_14782/g.20888 Transcript_14782/m.20888 type:complete len:173 (-) Transcript_14782:203-721(-)